MHQKDRAEKKLRGRDGFERYYGALFGARWQVLRAALLRETDPVPYTIGTAEPYYLDRASILAADMLPLDGAEKILDVCAAPGGKSLVLASRMEKTAMLFSNDRSPARVKRLKTVCERCAPPEIRARITVSCGDGARWGKNRSEEFDAILLDAPCSSERHVLTDEKYLAQWSPARIKSLAAEQWALLSAAFRLLKKNGFLLYATCAINPTENDAQLEKLLTKYADARIARPAAVPRASENGIPLPVPTETAYGYEVFPDTAGAGPLFFSVVKKML